MRRDDDKDSDDIDPEAPDESDINDSDEPDFIDCPQCGKTVTEEAEHCHFCGCYIEQARQRRGPPAWAILAGIALAAALVFLALRGAF